MVNSWVLRLGLSLVKPVEEKSSNNRNCTLCKHTQPQSEKQ